MATERTVSVVIPSYNGAKYIVAAIESALGQTFKDLEILVIDDGSTDETRELLSAYVNHGAIRYLYQPNAGLSAARNRGVKRAAGKYIALLDADDRWHTDKITRQLEVISPDSAIGMVYTRYNHFDNSGMTGTAASQALSGQDKPVTFKQLFRETNSIHPSTTLIRKEAFSLCGLFDTSLPAIGDYDLWLRIAKRFAIVGMDEPLADIRLHHDNMSRDIAVMTTHELATVKKHRNDVSLPAYLRRRAKVYLVNGDRYLCRKRYAKALLLLLQCLLAYPFLLPEAAPILMRGLLGDRVSSFLHKKIRSLDKLNKTFLYFMKKA